MFSTFKRLLSYVGYYKNNFRSVQYCYCLGAALELTSPLIAKRLIDGVMTPSVETGNLNILS